MESIIADILKTIFSRTDPVLVAVLIVLAVLWYRTDKKINDHLNPKNPYPHPECQWGEKSYKALGESLKQQHSDNREDHQILFNILRGNPAPDSLPPRKPVNE